METANVDHDGGPLHDRDLLLPDHGQQTADTRDHRDQYSPDLEQESSQTDHQMAVTTDDDLTAHHPLSSSAVIPQQIAPPKPKRVKRPLDNTLPPAPSGACMLALTKVRRIAKSESKISMLGGDASFLLAKSAELFIWRLTQDAFAKAKGDSRRTLQYKDLAAAVKDRPAFEFLLDIIPPMTTRDQYLSSVYATDPPRTVPEHK
uniref:Transcription factor CBF/NF-Y/archaeal histone domain-containing protein n=1 Tax=Spongospora subterranea TaxID=70186 RepID=A0A0H5R4Q6_9EUKA|eukprot:CRZ03069.1 hypothetical protein [Spongospora subterranea]